MANPETALQLTKKELTYEIIMQIVAIKWSSLAEHSHFWIKNCVFFIR